jgi:site-specific recombinase XerD
MTDNQTQVDIQWIEKRLDQIQVTTRALKTAIDEYLKWMTVSGYGQGTCKSHRNELNKFLHFICQRRVAWEGIFTSDTLKYFQKITGVTTTHAVKRLSRYLFEQNRTPQPIQKQHLRLPDLYEDYLLYYKKSRQVREVQVARIRRVLSAFHDYLTRINIKLLSIKIEQIDAFMAEFTKDFRTQTAKTYRSYLRGFFRYLYRERRVLRKDLAPLLKGYPMFARSKPPKYLRPHEIQQLFGSLKLSSTKDIRNYAIVHLAYCLGLRPEEISLITLDDISFATSELTLKTRKNNRPTTLPLPENTLKAIAVYVIGARPTNNHRRLFLNLVAPYRPIAANMTGRYITECIQKAGLPGTAYWLRHTYAQNLLEAGASIYEIKEMMGHDNIESTRKYLHIHIKLMREVLFGETL